MLKYTINKWNPTEINTIRIKICKIQFSDKPHLEENNA